MMRRGRAGMAARMMAARRAHRMRRRRRRRRVVLVGGLIAVGVHKFSKHDAERIEEHTGMPPEELEDADLNEAMAELGIADQPLTPDEQAQVQAAGGADEGEGAVAPAAPAAPAPAGGTTDVIAELERLGDLHAKGILSDDEFAAMKKQVLGQ